MSKRLKIVPKGEGPGSPSADGQKSPAAAPSIDARLAATLPTAPAPTAPTTPAPAPTAPTPPKADETKKKVAFINYSGQGGGSATVVEAWKGEGNSLSLAPKETKGAEKKDGSQVGAALAVTVKSALAAQTPAPPKDKDAPAPKLTLHIWKNGFSLDGGPLRGVSSSDRAFLDAVKQGKVPAELAAKYGEAVDVRLREHASDFHEAQRLGSLGPAHGVGTIRGGDGLALSGRLIVRLLDGQRFLCPVDPTAPLSSLRDSLNLLYPHIAQTPYALLSGHPPKVLGDETKSFKDLGLHNALVLLKKR